MDKDELLFLSWLTSVNTALGRYIARLMDEATGHDTTTCSTSPAEIESEPTGSTALSRNTDSTGSGRTNTALAGWTGSDRIGSDR
ncbi:hypothetical protein [Saccharothrix deserti]|uniref:hypothetical protein n=1 Tax=Saccharothrix deserti TaxID=2593674 RepID=UPI00131E67E5|nr:hypothetical protein [Saccharothrix deserti]